jgi:hypothetical protein
VQTEAPAEPAKLEETPVAEAVAGEASAEPNEAENTEESSENKEAE